MLTILWVVFITILSLVNFNNNALITVRNSDKVIHFFFYFVFTILLLKCFNDKLKYKYLIIIVLGVSYGIIIEILQSEFTSTRKADFYDVIANSAGIITAVVLNKYLFKSISSNIIKKN